MKCLLFLWQHRDIKHWKLPFKGTLEVTKRNVFLLCVSAHTCIYANEPNIMGPLYPSACPHVRLFDQQTDVDQTSKNNTLHCSQFKFKPETPPPRLVTGVTDSTFQCLRVRFLALYSYFCLSSLFFINSSAKMHDVHQFLDTRSHLLYMSSSLPSPKSKPCRLTQLWQIPSILLLGPYRLSTESCREGPSGTYRVTPQEDWKQNSSCFFRSLRPSSAHRKYERRYSLPPLAQENAL